MCDPGTLMGLSTAVSAVGSVLGGIQQNQAAKANAKMLRQQAAYEEQQARDAIERGKEEIREVQKAGAQVQGAATAGFSANNVDLGFGSPLDFMLSNAANIEQDIMRTAENAKREADGISFGASQTRGRANIVEAEGRNALASGSVRTLLSNVGIRAIRLQPPRSCLRYSGRFARLPTAPS